MADAVKSTLGPRGRNAILEKSWGSPNVTKDGVTVAKEIELEDRFENLGAQMLKEVASKTSDVAGDGTTTATVLAQAIYREGIKMVAAGASPMELKRGIEAAVEAVVTKLKETLQAHQGQEGNRSGRHNLRQQRLHYREYHCRSHGKSRQRGGHHGGRSQGHGDIPGSGRGHAVRSRVSLSILCDRSRAYGSLTGRALHPDSMKKRSPTCATCCRCWSR